MCFVQKLNLVSFHENEERGHKSLSFGETAIGIRT